MRFQVEARCVWQDHEYGATTITNPTLLINAETPDEATATMHRKMAEINGRFKTLVHFQPAAIRRIGNSEEVKHDAESILNLPRLWTTDEIGQEAMRGMPRTEHPQMDLQQVWVERKASRFSTRKDMQDVPKRGRKESPSKQADDSKGLRGLQTAIRNESEERQVLSRVPGRSEREVRKQRNHGKNM